MIRTRRLAVALAAVALSWTATDVLAQEVYRWVDDEGVTHYSSTPPDDRDAERVEASNPPADDPEESRAEIEQLRQSNKTRLYKKRLEREAKAEEKEERQERERFCSRLRDKRQVLATSPQVREQGEDSLRVISQEDREAKLQEFDQQLAKHCDGV